MAVRKEVKVLRECGYRKVGGLYLVGPLLSRVCDRLPFRLEPCPMCNHSFDFHRGLAKTSGKGIFHYEHNEEFDSPACKCLAPCPSCYPTDGLAVLMWVGKKFYTPESFTKEAERLGVSKRLPYIPKWLKLGEAWVFLAHPEAVEIEGAPGKNGGDQGKFFAKVPGVFHAFVPQRIEKIVVEKEAEHFSQEAIDKLDMQGIDIVTVPWGDPDHR